MSAVTTVEQTRVRSTRGHSVQIPSLILLSGASNIDPISTATYSTILSPHNTPCSCTYCSMIGTNSSPCASSRHLSHKVTDRYSGHATSTSAYCAQMMTRVSIPYLREALNSLDAKVASLMREREEVKCHLEQAARMQSPIQRLPSELLSFIFVIGVCGVDGGDSLMVSTLMLVCRYWADVALSTPALWSSISVSTHESLDKAQRKLALSKSIPLDVTINFSPRVEHSSEVTENVIHAMDFIRPMLWRVKSLRLSVPGRLQAHAALLRCQENAPILEILSIRIFHSMQEDHHLTPPLPLFNGHTPRLRSCSFTSLNFGWDVTIFSRLRVLKLGGYYNNFSPSVDTLIEILRQCSELEEFALRNMSDIEPDMCHASENDIFRPKVLQLRRLARASFYYAGAARTYSLLGQIYFPALEVLDFCYFDDLTPIFRHLKAQSLTSLPLRSLRIESSFFNEVKFIELICRLPCLTTLELVDVESVSSSLMKVKAQCIEIGRS